MINFSKRKKIEMEERYLNLVNDSKDKLYKIAYSYVKDSDDALDIIQETVYKGYISYHKVKNPEFEKTWITRILINTSIDYLKKKKKLVNLDTNIISEIPEEHGSLIDEKISVNQAMESLSEKEKTIIILRYFEDMKLIEVARLLNEPISTIKSTLYRSLKKLKIELTEDI